MAQRDEADPPVARGRPLGLGPAAFRPDDDRGVGRDRLVPQARQRLAPASPRPVRPASGSSPAAARRASFRTSAARECPGHWARRDCLTDASATRLHRSRRPARPSAATVTSVRAVTIGWMAATPSMTASRTMSSILSPLRTACTSVSGTDGFSRRLDARQHLHAHVAATRRSRPSRGIPGRGRRRSRPCRPARAAARASGARLRPSAAARSRRRDRARARRTDARGNYKALHGLQASGFEACCYTRAAMFFRGQIIGKYKILSTIGSGGFGTVYLAEDTWIDKKVALKVPHKQGVDFGELLREPRLLASLNHPNIVTILTAEKQENVFFIVMEFVPGETLESDHRARRRAGAVAGARLHLPDLQRGRSRAPPRRAASRPAAGQRARRRERHAEGRRLRHVALSGDRRARHDGHRQSAVHGAGAVSRQSGLRLRPLFARRHDVSDDDRRPAVRHALARRSRSTDARRARRSRRGSRIRRSPRRSATSSSKRWRRRFMRATSARATCWTMCSPRAAPGRGGRRDRRRPASRPRSRADDVQEIHSRLKAREAPQPRFCWHCRKPLHARSDRCPFCGEAQ